MTTLGRNGHVIQVFNNFAPLDDKPLIIPRKYVFTGAAPIVEDLTLGQMDQILPFIQSAFIDNPNNGTLSIYFPISDYTLRVGSNQQGIYPVYSPEGFQPTLKLIATDGTGALVAGNVEILWCNFAQPYSAWAAF